MKEDTQNIRYKITKVHVNITQENEWFNTTRALRAEDLVGRVILLDFWTFCCINCMHVIPELKKLEQEFGDKITVNYNTGELETIAGVDEYRN